MKETIKQLIEHVCGQAEFDEDKAYKGLEVIDYDWQKRFVRLLGRLADEIEPHAPQASGTLTGEQKAEYVKNRSGNCPFCNSPNIEGDQFDHGGDTVAQRIRCLRCEKAWDDVYTLTDVEEVDEGASPSAIVDSNDPNLTYRSVELTNGGCLEWDNGTIRYVDCNGNTEGTWEPGDEDYDTYKQYFPNHTVKPDEDHEADEEA